MRSWTCPYCNRPTTITDDLRDVGYHTLDVGLLPRTDLVTGRVLLTWYATRCPNTECRELTLSVGVLWEDQPSLTYLPTVRLRPDSFSKPQPDYIPQPIRDDYYEACKIRDLSPKAAATLARRSLQGIIRDFWKISKRTLHAEIDELKSKIDPGLWDAIHAVRKVGNIGAHMEQDVNVVIEIEPDEAQKLIGLVEILFEECYVARHNRELRLAQMTDLGKQKTAVRKTQGAD